MNSLSAIDSHPDQNQPGVGAFPFDTFMAALNRGDLCLTVNRRLARTLAKAYDQEQIHKGRQVWSTPEILPLSAWLQRLWGEWLDLQEESVPPLLLTPWQERTLWQEIIQSSPEGAGLMQVADAADQAMEASRLLNSWGLEMSWQPVEENEDVRAFRHWQELFSQHCQDNQWLVESQLIDFFQERLGEIPWPSALWLAGFDRITPQQDHFLTRLGDLGTTVTRLPPLSDPLARGVRVGFPDRRGEILAAAGWARDYLIKQTPNSPDQSSQMPVKMGVIVPDLDARRQEVARIFATVLDPQGWLPHHPPATPLFNISLGTPLDEEPLIRDALHLLTLGEGYLPLARYRELLHSPFWAGGMGEWSERALMDVALQRHGHLTISIEGLISAGLGEGGGGDFETPRESGENKPENPSQKRAPSPQLVQSLNRFREGFAESPKATAPPQEWATRFAEWLTLLGWPGERALDSREFQSVEAWRELLTTFASLERVVSDMTLGEALTQLRLLARESTFQTETPEAPIEIMGVLEAGGERFDALWIMGFSDALWPPNPEPNPFLPHNWQRDQGLPRSSREAELVFSQQVTTRLLALGREVVVSYPEGEEDLERRPSPLIMTLPPVDPEILLPTPPPTPAQWIGVDGRMETLPDHQAPPLSLQREKTSAGGSGILKAQSLCPFQAFARYRLGAREVETPEPGLSPLQRGNLTHWALDHLWGEIGSLARLRTLSGEAMQEVIHQGVTQAINKGKSRFPEGLRGGFQKLEQKRLERLLHRWLMLETERMDPFEVTDRERQQDLEIGGLTIHLRLDREDRLTGPGGGQILLDYKTGKVGMKDWFGERPKDPQLPLYYLAGGEKTVGVAFAQLLPGEVAFKGLSREPDQLPGVTTPEGTRHLPPDLDWQALGPYWQKTLSGIAEEYRDGVASRTPQTGACDYCDLTIFCRKHESSPEIPDGMNAKPSNEMDVTRIKEGGGEERAGDQPGNHSSSPEEIS
ncbi:MAG: PD-(D/E)XK nuclease family protein [Magnetococcales bacterium]|nr:PD-(D/E)XK nuclease family protein [Magnetococcales bacterium]